MLYLNYIQLNPHLQKFSRILEEFLLKYFKESDFKPSKCELSMFNFPGENYSEPMIKIRFPDINEFNNLKIKDNIEENFKLFLLNKSKDFKEFQMYRKIQQKFRFVIRRE